MCEIRIVYVFFLNLEDEGMNSSATDDGRGLIDDTTKTSWNSIGEFRETLRWATPPDNTFIDREDFPILGYAALSDCKRVVAMERLSTPRSQQSTD